MKHAHVMIVEDDQWLADEYTRTLKAADYSTSCAGNSIDAIEAIDTKKPACILLDLFLPGPNGLVLLHELQSHSDLSQIPVVLITNAANDIAGDSLRAYGVRQVLDKATMRPGDVLTAVKKVLP